MTTLKDKINQGELITKQQFEKMYRIGHDTSHELLHTRGFPCFKIGRKYYIVKDKVNDWMLIHFSV